MHDVEDPQGMKQEGILRVAEAASNVHIEGQGEAELQEHRGHVRDKAGVVFSNAVDSHQSNGEMGEFDSRSLEVIRPAVFSNNAQRIIVTLLTSNTPLTISQLHALNGIGKRGFDGDMHAITQAKNSILSSKPSTEPRSSEFSIVPAWRDFFAKTARGSDHQSFSMGNFARLRPLFDKLDNVFIIAWFPHLLKRPQTFSELRKIMEVSSYAKSDSEIRKWLTLKCSKLESMLFVDCSSDHADDPLVSLHKDFHDWFLQMNSALSVAIGKTASKRLHFNLSSLSEIEGYEFLDDLDEDFGEELRLFGVDPVSPTTAKPGSVEKVEMLAARYAAGVLLWNEDDCYDHGEGSTGTLFVDYEEVVPPEEEDPDGEESESEFDIQVGDPKVEKNRRIIIDDQLAAEKAKKKRRRTPISRSSPPIPQGHE